MRKDVTSMTPAERAARILSNVGRRDFDTVATVAHKVRQRARDCRDILAKNRSALYWFDVAEILEDEALSLIN